MNRLRTLSHWPGAGHCAEPERVQFVQKAKRKPVGDSCIAAAVSTATPMPTSTPTVEPTAPPPRPVVGYTPVPSDTVSPIVVQRSPEPGQEFAPGGGIQLVFDRAMNQSAVESAFAIQPAASPGGRGRGKFAWADLARSFSSPINPWRVTRSTTWF